MVSYKQSLKFLILVVGVLFLVNFFYLIFYTINSGMSVSSPLDLLNDTAIVSMLQTSGLVAVAIVVIYFVTPLINSFMGGNKGRRGGW